MAGWEFVKMHGIGNDFVVVDERGREPFPKGAAATLCDRHTGIGADGVLVIGEARQPEAVARMDVWNADGTAAEMCGNGIRCVALRLAKEGDAAESPKGDTVTIETGAGVKHCRIFEDGTVEVDMGRAVIEGSIDSTWELDGHTVHATRVRTGNPHLVTFDPIQGTERQMIASELARHPTFPAGTNVEFARIEGEHVALAVWERGVGFTRACGTGACATVAAACASSRLAYGHSIVVSLPGGELVVTIPGPKEPVHMRGPAAYVFSGRVEIPGT